MNKLYKLFAIAAALVSVSACNLDLFPFAQVVIDENAPLIQTAQDIDSYRGANYLYFRSVLGGTNYAADDLMCDAFNATIGFGNNWGAVHRADDSFTSGDSDVLSFWASHYSAINKYNLVIADVEKCTDENLKDAVIELAGEAKFLRAFSYLALARRFGNYYDPATAATDLCVPLVLVYDQTARPARNTVAEVYEQIKKDLDDAYDVLGSVSYDDVLKMQQAAGTDNALVGAYYAHADAVKALYANYYLDVRDYDLAFQYADEIIQSGTYPLATTEADFRGIYSSDNGKEAIMMCFGSKTEGVNSLSLYTSYNSDGNSPTGDAYRPYFIPSQKLVSAYANTDFRRKNWFDQCHAIPFADGGGRYINDKFFIFTKYAGNPSFSSANVPDGRVMPVVYSIAEMYLVAAEAGLNATGKKMAALAHLNTLQNARKGTASAMINAKEVHDEWFRETVGEGKRMECLKRWNEGCDVRTPQAGALAEAVVMEGAAYGSRALAAGDHCFVWPIPAYEMKINSHLVQNPGYGYVDVE